MEVSEAEGANRNKLRATARSSPVHRQVKRRLQEDWSAKPDISSSVAHRIQSKHRRVTNSYFLTAPLTFTGASKAGRGDGIEVAGDVTYRIEEGEVAEAYATVSETFQTGYDKSVTTYRSENDQIVAHTDEVFAQDGTVLLDPEETEATGTVTTQASSLCTFCDGVGNVICAVGCGVAYSLIVASVAVSPPAGVAAGAVVSAFCGLVTLYNESATGTGCGADWTTEQICGELYGC
ncbi:hypothetical protein BRC97_10425 [Halobacteriales archaeon QS_6_71_20]|nr:MAG: hypothetical protein BRC97_10425 [Halobacteriales archaeon QS_6_71_20]